ncbi:MAG: CarD family transcriptional regulator [Acidimicrobiia bacterium]|nr:CarD family transcriptional regulator [Acidimicrobiia bacterium]
MRPVRRDGHPRHRLGSERDYLLLEYRGADKLYVPSDQIDAVRHYTGGDEPVAQPAGW